MVIQLINKLIFQEMNSNYSPKLSIFLSDNTSSGQIVVYHINETKIPNSRIILQESSDGDISEGFYLQTDPHCFVKYWFCPSLKSGIRFLDQFETISHLLSSEKLVMATHDYFPHVKSHYDLMILLARPYAWTKLRPIIDSMVLVVKDGQIGMKNMTREQKSVQVGLYYSDVGQNASTDKSSHQYLDIFNALDQVKDTKALPKCHVQSLESVGQKLDFFQV